MFSVIILAAGSSLRMSGVNKQLAEIDGLPVFVMSAKKFDELEKTAEIIIAAPKGEAKKYLETAKRFGVKKLAAVCEGGSTRFESVKKALAYVSEGCAHIAVHDGARPLISPSDIEKVFADAEKYGAAAAAVPATDTVKIAAENGFIEKTPPRERVFYAQTPQAFDKELYISCVKKLVETDVTDDASVLEKCGEKVRITELSCCNMKITRPEDLEAARIIHSHSLIKEL